MSQTEKIKQSIENLAQVALGHRKLDEETRNRISAAIEGLHKSPPPKILLFGVSQAGKSTLLSAVMRGEQFVPIGIGTATTVVPTELWPVTAAAEERAVIFLKSPQEVFASMEETLSPHIDISVQDEDDAAPARQGAKPSSASSSDRAQTSAVNEFRKLRHWFRHAGLLGDKARAKRYEPAPVSVAEAQAHGRERLRSNLMEALNEAEEHFRQLMEQGEPTDNGEKLVMARALLSYYETYEQQYGEGVIELPLAEAHAWLRRPPDWMQRHEFEKERPLPYSFDEVKCFYAKRAQLFVRCVEGVSRVCLVDAPGYGITPFDDEVLNKEALQADSIILILGSQGSQITEAQLNQIGLLSQTLDTQSGRNLSRNPFVLWNAKGLPQQQAEGILRNDLSAMRRVLGLSIPGSRAMVANFLLALRAAQLLRFQELSELSIESIHAEACDKGFPADESGAESKRDYVRRYLSETLSQGYQSFTYKRLEAERREEYERALAASNLHSNLDSIIGLIAQTHEAILLADCAKVVLDVLRRFLLTRPTQAKVDELNRQIEELTRAIPQFGKGVYAQQKKFEGIVKDATRELKTEFAATLWESSHYKNLKASIKTEIDKTFSRTYVPGIKRRSLRQLMMTRLQLWLQQVEKKESSRLRNHLLSEYQLAWLSLRDGLKSVCKTDEGLLTLPDLTDPNFDLSEFKSAFEDWLDATLELEFPDYIFEGTTKNLENFKVEAIESGRKLANWGRKLFKMKVKKYPPPKRFDKPAAKADVGEEVDAFYQNRKDLIPHEEMWQTAHRAFAKGIDRAFDDNSKAYDKLLTERLAELRKEVLGNPAPLTEEEWLFLSRLAEALESSLVLAQQLARHDNLSPL